MINISFRTPAQFLEEVLLVDDFSDKEDLGEVKLEKNRRKRLQELFQGLKNYIRIFRGLVRLVRNTEREGLIRLINHQNHPCHPHHSHFDTRSRTRGAKEAKGVVVVFLDAHCEVDKKFFFLFL